MVRVRGEGFQPNEEVPIDLARPQSDDVMGRLTTVTADVSGGFSAAISLGRLGCQAAALQDRFGGPPGQIVIYAGLRQDVLFVAARASYAYTTMAVQPQPTLTLSPSSGPCDDPVEVTGSGFPVPSGPFPYVAFYLVEPGSADVNAGSVGSAHIERDGSFSQWVGLRHGGCDAAALDSRSEQPTGYLIIGATLSLTAVQVGVRIPDIMATAQYSYGTTTPPRRVMTVSPASGPCDGTVQVTGTGFYPGEDATLGWAYPGSESSLGRLASVVADAGGRFASEVTLGETGCAAAQAFPGARDASPPRLRIDALPVGQLLQVGTHLAYAYYTFTTVEVGGMPIARSLPGAGTGPGEVSTHVPWTALAVVLGVLGLPSVTASLLRGRQQD
jgi:hypothetical protein